MKLFPHNFAVCIEFQFQLAKLPAEVPDSQISTDYFGSAFALSDFNCAVAGR